MKTKQSLMAALVGIAGMIAMPLAATAGDHYANKYENTQWQERGAVIPAGHYYGWRNRANNSGLICDEDGDDCHPALQCDEDGDDCRPAVQCDADGDDCEPSTGYEGQSYTPSHRGRAYNNYGYNPGYGRGYGAPAYQNYDYNSGYGGAYNAPYDNNGAYGGLSTLAPMLQQFVR